MRVAVNSFRGEVPRITPRALPENAAQVATNARPLTGDLEAWRQFALEKVLANSPGPIKTIYKLKDVWLSWLTDVNAARGAVAGDTTYRLFLTGPDVYDRPQFTNYAMATSGPEPYPADTRPLGVPGPGAAPAVVAGIDPNPTTFNVNIFDEGDQFATSWTGAPSQFAHGGATTVQQSAVVGHPAPSYETLFDDNPGAPAYLYRNFGVEKCTVVRMSFDFYMSSGSGNYFQMNSGIMRTLAGAGVVIGLAQSSPGQGLFGVGTAQGWTIIGQASLVASSPVAVSFSTWYTCEVQMLTNSDGTQTVTATLSLGSVQLAAVTATGTFLNGDYGGFYSETSNNDGSDRYRTYYDNILVQGSGATGYIAANVATNYVYTYVNDLGQESAPSFASVTVLRPDGIAITVTTPTVVPSGFDDYSIATKRIYRAVDGATGASYQFVAEIPLAQADYVDSIPTTELGETLQSELWALPPDDLQGLVALPNGVLAGFSKNQLCLSAQNFPHAWPVEYRLNVDTDIVAIGVIDTTVVIGTQNFIYLAIGTDPAAYSMTKLEVPQACVAKRSLAYLVGIGVVFASPDGLIAVAGNGNVRNLTSSVFTRDQWQALAPETILGVAHDDVYHFWYGELLTGEWTDRTLPATAAWQYTTWSDELGIFVSVGDSAQCATSVDGVTWVPQAMPSSAVWTRVVWARELSMFVAVAYGSSKAATSPDGVTWTARTLPVSAQWGGLAWNGSTLVLVENNGMAGSRRVLTSVDGIVWIDHATALPTTSSWDGIVWAEELGVFCTVASFSTSAAISPDGIAWAARTLPSISYWREIAWSGSTFVVTDFTAGATQCLTSPDGVTWTARALPAAAAWGCVAWNRTRSVFCMVGSGITSLFSYDGVTWTTSTMDSSRSWFTICWGPGPGVFVALAQDVTNVANSLLYSASGGEGGLQGYALDMKADGFGLIELGYHTQACFADPLTDNLYLALDSAIEPSDPLLPLPVTTPIANGVTIYKFNAPDGDGHMVYRWKGKLNLLAHPAAFVYCQVRADDYDNLVLRTYANGVQLSEDVIVDEVPFTLPLVDDYTTFELELLGTSRVRTVQVAEDISEFD